MTVKGATRGRKPDTTPGKEFAAKKIRENSDGSVVYQIPYNDENGNRKFREETKMPGKRGGGRTADVNPNKVFTPTFERNDDGDMVLCVPFNDSTGNRTDGIIIVSVVNDRLVATNG